jgi:2-dehydropantoate 2-reductase
MTNSTRPRIAVLGAGAVGCWFGGVLAQGGADVVLIGRPVHMDAVRAHGLVMLRGETRALVRLDAATDAGAAADADIVLCCVKSGDTDRAMAQLRGVLAPHALVASLQNGVDNAERASAVLGRRVLPTVVYVGCEMAGPGVVRHLGRGDLVLPRGDADAERLVGVLVGAGVPCALHDDIAAALWSKLVINCAYNPVSALGRQPYGVLLQHDDARRLMETLARETIAVAQASGVRVDGPALLAGLWAIGEAMPGQFSSTSQDLERGRRTEIDALNGCVALRGAALGVPVPANDAVATLIRLRETSAAS